MQDDPTRARKPALSLVSNNPNPAPFAPSVATADVHQYWAPQLEAMTPIALKSVYIDMIDNGPASLMEAIEAEFLARGLDPFTLEPLRP